jgi:hypothetical protein
MRFLSSDHKAFKPVAKARETIEQLLQKIDLLATAPLPEEDALPRVKRWIESSRDNGGYRLAAWATSPDPHDRLSGGYGWTVGGDNPPVDLLQEITRILTWVCPELIEQACLAEIKRRLECNPPGPPMAERPAMRAKLEADLLKAEIAEEAAIESLEAEGWLIHRRPDARPEIILGEVTA